MVIWHGLPSSTNKRKGLPPGKVNARPRANCRPCGGGGEVDTSTGVSCEPLRLAPVDRPRLPGVLRPDRRRLLRYS